MIASSAAVMAPRRRVNRLLSTTTVAHRLNVSERTVRRLCEDGHIRAGQVGNQWRIPQGALDDYCRRTFGAVEPGVAYRRN